MHVLIVSIIDDPLDPPGHGRIGGGHQFIFDLGRYLIRRGHRITYLVRRNDDSKAADETLGDRCRIRRMAVGPGCDVDPSKLAPLIEEICEAAVTLLPDMGEVATVHSHYWIGGHVARRLIAQHPAHHVHSILSLGRVKTLTKDKTALDDIRDRTEVEVFNGADRLIAACPNEFAELTRLYPEVRSNHVHVIPYGVDPDVFFPRPERSDRLVRRAARRLAEGSSDVSRRA